MKNIILVVDDDKTNLILAQKILSPEYRIAACNSGMAALKYLEKNKPHLILLDISMPEMDGFEVLEKLRQDQRTEAIPIIFLTASDEETSVIRGLDCGGDDYITKPFKLGELCSRIRALLRRSSMQGAGEGVLRSGEVTVNLAEGRVFLHGEPVEFTGAEYRLLCLLLKNSGRVLTRGMILDKLWDGAGNFVDDNTLSVYVRRLREKLEENPSRPEHLKTVRGFGYQWKE